MPITRETTVREALDSCDAALALFQEHGVDPAAECGLECYVITLDRAESRCELQRVDELIEELNAAIVRER